MSDIPPTAQQRHAPILLWIVGICAGLEAIFTLAGMPPFNVTALRGMGIVLGAFWNGLLHDVPPIYPGQPVVMFLSHAFLHGGFMHMLFNMLLLLHLGREAVLRLGQKGFALLFAVSAMSGGAMFALLSSSDNPMLGASGVVFGLFGATMYWDLQRRRFLGAPIGPVFRMGVGLIVMNVVLFVLVDGMLAWETHLGGFVGGVLFARIATPSLGHRWRQKR